MFKWMNISAFFESVCIYPGLKYETMNIARHLCLYIFPRLFLHDLCVLNFNLSDKILYLVLFTFK